MSPKGPPFNVFDILQPTGVSQSPKGPPSMFLIFCNQLEFHKAQRVPTFTILSLRYSADFGRSRLVDKLVHGNVIMCVEDLVKNLVIFVN